MFVANCEKADGKGTPVCVTAHVNSVDNTVTFGVYEGHFPHNQGAKIEEFVMQWSDAVQLGQLLPNSPRVRR